MSWFGTDLVALGCIFGGAAVGGAATLFLTEDGGHADVGCAVEAMAVSPRIAISHGGEARAIVVTPDISVHTMGDCARHADGMVEIQMGNHLEHLDTKLQYLDQALEIQLQQMESQLEAEWEQQIEARAEFEEAMRQMESARVKVTVKGVGGGGS